MKIIACDFDNICKYYNQDIEITRRYIDCLYNLPDCSCGGMLHIIVDDDNVEDENLDWCLKYIREEKDVDKDIDELILKNMKNMTVEQRRLLTIGRRWVCPFGCPAKLWGINGCQECIIENEDVE